MYVCTLCSVTHTLGLGSTYLSADLLKNRMKRQQNYSICEPKPVLLYLAYLSRRYEATCLFIKRPSLPTSEIWYRDNKTVKYGRCTWNTTERSVSVQWGILFFLIFRCMSTGCRDFQCLLMDDRGGHTVLNLGECHEGDSIIFHIISGVYCAIFPTQKLSIIKI